jgi:tetratricopeptide (TPR) repeat protein
MSARVPAIVCSLSFACLSAAFTLLPQQAYAQQQKDHTVNLKMGPLLKAATTAAQNKQYDVALAKVKEAEAEKKTSFEQFKIYETLAFIYYGQKKYAEAANAYEKQMETPQFLMPEQLQSIPKTIAQMYAAAGQHAKVIEYGKRWLQDKPNDAEMLSLVGQSYYSTKDNKACQQSFSAAVSAAEKAGSRPQEPWLRYTQVCANAVGDESAETQAYEKLVRYYPKAEYWQAYLRRASRNERDDIATFNWLRLMSDTGSLKSSDDYMQYAQLAITDYGVPCEAVRALEDGFKKNILGVEERAKARQQNTLVRAKEAVQADKARLSQLASEAEGDATGQKYVELGMIYFGCEQNDQAIANLDKGLKKGGGKQPANAKLALGIAQLRKGDRESARSTFKSLSADKSLGKVAGVWLLRT